MKKPFLFYVFWDVLFFVYLYLFYRAAGWAKQMSLINFGLGLVNGVSLLFAVLAGILFAVLAFGGMHRADTKKAALLELLIVGIPALYGATATVLPFWLLSITGAETMPGMAPIWLIYKETPTTLCGLVLGYELCAFVIRMRKFKKAAPVSDDAKIANASAVTPQTE